MTSVVAIVLGLLLLASPASAQLQQGTIVGSLTGPAGVSINEARITLFDQLGNAVTTVTANNGQFRLTNVAIGSYSLDRKSTRLNSSHSQISYAVFCLKKKK